MERRPDLVICAGACGALTERLRPLDVVVAESTVEYDFKLRFVKLPVPALVGDRPKCRLNRSRERAPVGLP
jgi:nucleoside phosphorylase